VKACNFDEYLVERKPGNMVELRARARSHIEANEVMEK